jgi:GrpB-like predicted nucleotidyltransferase (UPF0157 family)
VKKRIVRHRPEWKLQFADEAERIRAALGESVAAVHHIGSTAIPGIVAKPTIDILVEISELSAADQRAGAMEKIGYRAKGEFGIPQRRYFQKRNRAGASVFHVHVFQSGSPHVKRHLAFRDFLRRFPEKAAAYSRVKIKLADESGLLVDDYQDRKASFVRMMEAEALAWRETTSVPRA